MAPDRSCPALPGLRIAFELPGSKKPAELMLFAAHGCAFVPREFWEHGGWVELGMSLGSVAMRFERVATVGNEAVFRAVESLLVHDAMQAPEGSWLLPLGRRRQPTGEAL